MLVRSRFTKRTARPRNNPKKSGYTLVEMVIAAALSVLAFGGISALLIGGMSNWITGEAKVDAEDSAEQGVRIIAGELRSAMMATVDANGLGVTYELPAKDANGDYLTPITWDGVTRRIVLQGTNLNKIEGNATYTIVQGVSPTDPLSPAGKSTYRIFTPGLGQTTYQITMELVTDRDGVKSASLTARNRETIYLRNIPQISR